MQTMYYCILVLPHPMTVYNCKDKHGNGQKEKNKYCILRGLKLRLAIALKSMVDIQLAPEEHEVAISCLCLIFQPKFVELFIQQVKVAIKIAEFNIQNILLFLFDQSSGHCAYAEDALIVSRMNVSDGGNSHLRSKR